MVRKKVLIGQVGGCVLFCFIEAIIALQSILKKQKKYIILQKYVKKHGAYEVSLLALCVYQRVLLFPVLKYHVLTSTPTFSKIHL